MKGVELNCAELQVVKRSEKSGALSPVGLVYLNLGRSGSFVVGEDSPAIDGIVHWESGEALKLLIDGISSFGEARFFFMGPVSGHFDHSPGEIASHRRTSDDEVGRMELLFELEQVGAGYGVGDSRRIFLQLETNGIEVGTVAIDPDRRSCLLLPLEKLTPHSSAILEEKSLPPFSGVLFTCL